MDIQQDIEDLFAELDELGVVILNERRLRAHLPLNSSWQAAFARGIQDQAGHGVRATPKPGVAIDYGLLTRLLAAFGFNAGEAQPVVASLHQTKVAAEASLTACSPSPTTVILDAISDGYRV